MLKCYSVKISTSNVELDDECYKKNTNTSVKILTLVLKYKNHICIKKCKYVWSK